jgi:hypothetical protein
VTQHMIFRCLVVTVHVYKSMVSLTHCCCNVGTECIVVLSWVKYLVTFAPPPLSLRLTAFSEPVEAYSGECVQNM